MTNDNTNFDELARKAFAPGAGETDYERLFAAAFSLPDWHFIADGNPPNMSPYCALFPDFFGNQPAVAVFTDTERARKFMAESNTEFGSADKPIKIDYGGLSAKISSEDLILSVAAGDVLDYIEKLIPNGVVKIFFNPNRDSHGFSNDLKIMRPIREHLESKNLLSKSADRLISEDTTQPSVKTLIVQIKDGLGFPSGFVKASEDAMRLFCRIPENWVDGEQLKPVYLEKIYARFYGANWRTGNSDGSHYKILDSYTKIFTPETVKATKFGGTVNQDKHQFFFYIADKNDSIRKVTAEEFQADIDAETQTEKSDAESKKSAVNSEIFVAPFDELSRKATETNATEDLSALFGAAFALTEWQFISRGELPDVYPYVASNARYADNQPMIRAFTDSKRLIRFAKENNLTDADGSCRSLTIPTANIIEYLEGFIEQGAYGVWFNSDTESSGFFIPIRQLRPIKEHLAKLNQQPPPSNLQNRGLAESTDGEIDLNLTVDKVGTVDFETSIAPFYEAVLPLLTDYEGVGDYAKLLRFEPTGMSGLVENIAENSHGAYLQIRRFLYLNPKNKVRIGVNSIHSKSLRHVRANSELVISFELCKNLDKHTAAFYHAFQGPKSEILKLSAAIHPILEKFGYQAADKQ